MNWLQQGSLWRMRHGYMWNDMGTCTRSVNSRWVGTSPHMGHPELHVAAHSTRRARGGHIHRLHSRVIRSSCTEPHTIHLPIHKESCWELGECWGEELGEEGRGEGTGYEGKPGGMHSPLCHERCAQPSVP